MELKDVRDEAGVEVAGGFNVAARDSGQNTAFDSGKMN
jgi:hypothetical protein